jgi:hypothetical protein
MGSNGSEDLRDHGRVFVRARRLSGVGIANGLKDRPARLSRETVSCQTPRVAFAQATGDSVRHPA